MHHMESLPLEYLDLIPDDIYRRLVTFHYSSERPQKNKNNLEQRCLSILAIRSHLLSAQTIEFEIILNWLKKAPAHLLYKKITSPQLLNKTRNNSSYTDEVLLQILDWLDSAENPIKHSEQNKTDSNRHQSSRVETNQQRQTESHSEEQQVKSLNESRHQDGISTMDQLTDSENLLNFQAVQSLNKRFALQRQIGWDLKKGIKKKVDEQVLLKFHKTIKSSKYLQSIIRLIGRDKSSKLDELPLEGIRQALQPGSDHQTGIPDEHLINSVTGVYRGDELARMLSSELQLLGHPSLKLLWHAKRADRQLLNYHYQGVSSEQVPEVSPYGLNPLKSGKEPIKQQGPMVLCVDTSASMKGKPEYRAKAVALEAIRVARLERRACYVFCYSGQDEVTELYVDLQQTGWQPIIDFLSFSFHGGTDINAVMHRAFGLLVQKQWSNADVVLISDGRFKIKQSLRKNITLLNSKTRIFGIQVSHWNSSAFGDICHQTFELNNV